MGFGPSQVLLPCSGTARPGQAGGGGASTEQQTRPPDAAPRSFLLKAKPPENQSTIKVKPCMLHVIIDIKTQHNKYCLSTEKNIIAHNTVTSSTKQLITW